MRRLERFIEARNTVEGKIISVILAFFLAFSLFNLPVFVGSAVAEDSIKDTEMLGKASDTMESEETEQNVEASLLAANQEGSEAGEDESGSEGEQEGASGEGEGTETEPEPEPTEPFVFDAETGTLTITGIETLDKDAFNNAMKELGIKATDVKSAVINDVKNIASYGLFYDYNYKAMESVEFNNVGSIGDHAFFKAPKLTTLKFRNVGTIEANAFAESKAVVSVDMDGVTTVGDEAFRQCTAMTDLAMKNIISFGRSPFSFCTGLAEADLDGKADGIGALGKTMFSDCAGLKKVTLKNFESVPDNMLQKCSALESVEMHSIGTIGMSIFQNCPNLNALTIADIKTIGEEAFVGATVKELSLNNVKLVGKNAFASCKSLQNVTIDNVDTLGQYAFYNCTGLQTVTMDHIRFIDNYAFWNCQNLTTIDSLKNVTERINGFVFFNCNNLNDRAVADLVKMGYIGSNDAIMERVREILAGRFQLDDAEEIGALTRDEENWLVGAIGQSSNWNTYENGTQIMQQARWSDAAAGVAEVQVDAYYTGEKQMDYIFVADLSASMAQLGNAEDMNARFYDMQSKLLDMTGQLLDTPGYDCRVAVVTFGGEHQNNATSASSGFISDATEAANYIMGLEPLNENTDYGLGMREALGLVQGNSDRNTVVVFLSDGAPNKDTSKDQYGTKNATEIRNLGVPIYGVLHSPTSGQHDKALQNLAAVCGTDENVSESFDTESFGRAMNAAFTAVYGNNTVTVPVNAEEFDVSDISVTAGEATYADGVITWTLNGMPFTDHKLTYSLTLKEDVANRVGTYTYSINDGDASFGSEGGASAGISLTVSRTVEAPDVPVPPTTPDNPVVPVTPATGGGAPAGAGAGVVPAATAAAAAPAAATVTITDDGTPLAQAADAEQTIADDENPLGAFDEPHCWVHWLMLAGILLTVVYAAAVLVNRRKQIKDLDDLENKLIGSSDAQPDAAYVPAGAHIG